MQKKVDAFTIADLVVALVISSIITTMAYFILQLVKKQLDAHQLKLHNANQFYFFESTWTRDWNKCLFIKDSAGVGIVFQHEDGSHITYDINNGSITRHQESVSDTLPVSVKNIQLHYCRPGVMLVQQADIDIMLEGQEIKNTYYKIYSVKDLLLSGAK